MKKEINYKDNNYHGVSKIWSENGNLIHTGNYKDQDKRLVDVIHEITKINDLKRIRISSIEITEIDDKFLTELKNNLKICNR